jgi:small subunit ribosomal protein S17
MKSVIGKVISDKMTNTVVVEVKRLVAHPKYSKRLRRSSKFHAHNEIGAKTGDTVKIVEIKPMSKTKNWKVEAVI